ncbi:hypothetical protein [Rubinisphaera brasiliensis]|nr:hypothetical protein [Rubinisphaera brasiliensis]
MAIKSTLLDQITGGHARIAKQDEHASGAISSTTPLSEQAGPVGPAWQY